MAVSAGSVHLFRPYQLHYWSLLIDLAQFIVKPPFEDVFGQNGGFHFGEHLGSDALVLEDAESSSELVEVLIGLLDVLQHALEASLVQNVVFVSIDHLGPLLGLLVLGLRHLTHSHLKAL
jgi:hypothetical protein